MTRTRLCVILVALACFAAACGGEDGDDAATASSTTSVATTTTPPTTVATTTTEATSTTTTEAQPVGPVYPLTGEGVEGAVEPTHPAVVVKISNNDSTARAALRGLEDADIIFEERIEQQATRFAAVFHSTLPTEVGSVRSGRTSDVDIVANLNRPIFAFSGANDGVHAQIRRADNDGLLIRASADFGDREFSRISDFRAPDNLVADVSALLEKADDNSGAPTPIFEYSNNVVELGTPSPGVKIDARTAADYVWSESTGGYLRSQGGEPLTTRDGVRIAPANVIVLGTNYVASTIDRASVDAITVGTGPVIVYSNGFRVEGTWRREFQRDGYTLETSDGQIIGLAPGQTWVSLTPGGTSRELSVEEADSLR